MAVEDARKEWEERGKRIVHMESGWKENWERSNDGSEEIFTLSHQLCCFLGVGFYVVSRWLYLDGKDCELS